MILYDFELFYFARCGCCIRCACIYFVIFLSFVCVWAKSEHALPIYTGRVCARACVSFSGLLAKQYTLCRLHTVVVSAKKRMNGEKLGRKRTIEREHKTIEKKTVKRLTNASKFMVCIRCDQWSVYIEQWTVSGGQLTNDPIRLVWPVKLRFFPLFSNHSWYLNYVLWNYWVVIVLIN